MVEKFFDYDTTSFVKAVQIFFASPEVPAMCRHVAHVA